MSRDHLATSEAVAPSAPDGTAGGDGPSAEDVKGTGCRVIARPRHRRQQFAITGLSVVLSLGAAELVVRAVRPQMTLSAAKRYSPGYWRPSDILPAELVAGYARPTINPETKAVVQLTINSRGLRSPEFATPKPSGTFRILVLGDSFAFNTSMSDEQVYTRILEDRLNQSSLVAQRRFEVINCGYADGYSADSYIAFMQQRGFGFEPDLVMMQYFVRNDVVDLLETRVTAWRNELPAATQSDYRWVDADGSLRSRYTDFKYRVPLLRESHFFIGLYNLFRVEGLARRLMSFVVPNYRGHNFEPNRVGISYQGIYQDPLPPIVEEAFERSMDLIARFNALCRARGVSLVVVIVPTGIQVNRTAWMEKFGQQLRYEEEADQVFPQRRIVARLAAAGMRVFDPLAEYRQAARLQPLYLGQDRDGHWTVAGNRVTAQILFRYLTRTGFINA